MSERLRIGEETVSCSVRLEAGAAARVILSGEEFSVSQLELRGDELSFCLDGRRLSYSVLVRPDEVQVSDGRRCLSMARIEEGAAAEDCGNGGQLVSRMPGMLLKLLVQPGTPVKRGTPLLILEAMKMEHEVCAPADGIVQGYPKQAGERVMPGDLLVEFRAS